MTEINEAMKVVREDVKALKEEGTQNTESILHMSRTVLALKEEGTNNTESIIEMSNSIINTINNPRPARTTEAINRSLVENAEELLKIDLDINYNYGAKKQHIDRDIANLIKACYIRRIKSVPKFQKLWKSIQMSINQKCLDAAREIKMNENGENIDIE